eukprot:3342614-Rhodomonas_salina.1
MLEGRMLRVCYAQSNTEQGLLLRQAGRAAAMDAAPIGTTPLLLPYYSLQLPTTPYYSPTTPLRPLPVYSLTTTSLLLPDYPSVPPRHSLLLPWHTCLRTP